MAGARGVMTTKTSFVGAKVVARAPVCARRAHAGSYRRHATQAKYGDDGKYFDLNVSQSHQKERWKGTRFG